MLSDYPKSRSGSWKLESIMLNGYLKLGVLEEDGKRTEKNDNTPVQRLSKVSEWLGSSGVRKFESAEVREWQNFRILELQNFRTCIQRLSNVSEIGVKLSLWCLRCLVFGFAAIFCIFCV